MKDENYYEGSRREFLEIAAQVDVPAFIRRGRYVEESAEALVAAASVHRQEMLEFARWRLGTLAALINGRWSRLHDLIGVEATEYLGQLHTRWQPELRVPVTATDNAKKVRRAIQDVVQSLDKFNRQWKTYIAKVDLSEVNHARDQYNRYYVTEKAAAFQSERLGQDGFEEFPPYEVADLLLALPYLHVPKLIA